MMVLVSAVATLGKCKISAAVELVLTNNGIGSSVPPVSRIFFIVPLSTLSTRAPLILLPSTSHSSIASTPPARLSSEWLRATTWHSTGTSARCLRTQTVS